MSGTTVTSLVIPEKYSYLPVRGTPVTCGMLKISRFSESPCHRWPQHLVIIGCICESVKVAYQCSRCYGTLTSGLVQCGFCRKRDIRNYSSLIEVLGQR